MFKLLGQRGALAFLLAGFMNAFVDLGHKIIIQNTVFKIYDGSQQVILTAIVISFGVLAFTVALGYRASQAVQSDDLDALRSTDNELDEA